MMKRRVLSLLMFIFIMYAQPVFAADISVTSGNGDKVGILNNIKITDPAAGNVVSIFGDIYTADRVNGDIVAVFGNITVDSQVSGNVITVFGNAKLTNKAVVSGNIVALGHIDKTKGSKIFGQEVNVNLGFLSLGRSAIIVLLSAFGIVVFVFGLPMLLIFNRRFENMAQSLQFNIGRRIALGFLLLAALTLLLPLLSITVIGLVLYFIMLICAELLVCIYFGKVLTAGFKINGNIFLQFFTGFLFISLIRIILIIATPQVGLLWTGLVFLIFNLYISSFGIGIMYDSRLGNADGAAAAAGANETKP